MFLNLGNIHPSRSHDAERLDSIPEIFSLNEFSENSSSQESESPKSESNPNEFPDLSSSLRNLTTLKIVAESRKVNPNLNADITQIRAENNELVQIADELVQANDILSSTIKALRQREVDHLGNQEKLFDDCQKLSTTIKQLNDEKAKHLSSLSSYKKMLLCAVVVGGIFVINYMLCTQKMSSTS